MKYCTVIIITAVMALVFQPTAHAAEDLIPNDPGFTQQWYLQKIHAPEAWAEGQKKRGSLGQGSADVIVAVIDTGVDINHPDLQENIWTNPREIPANGIDDDHNGFIDDVHGWDFLTNSPDPRPKLEKTDDLATAPLAVHHGTILAGIIGAVGNNNQGISGVNWRVSILPVRAIHSDGAGDADTVSRAIQYAIDQNANVINFSFVGDHNTPELSNAIKKAYSRDILIVAAAGNEIEQGESAVVRDLGATSLYPICYDADRDSTIVLGVTSTDREDKKSSFASFGSRCIDVSAPGESIFSTRSTDPQFGAVRAYGSVNGTSMATAVASGAAGWLKAIVPTASMRSISLTLIDSSDVIDTVNPSYRGRLGAGRLNIAAALQLLTQKEQTASSVSVSSSVTAQPLPTIVSTSPSSHGGGTIVRFQQERTADRELFLPSPWRRAPSLALLADGRIALGAPVGYSADVRVYSSSGEFQTSFTAYPRYRGGVWVEAVMELGTPRIITMPQVNAGSHVRVFTPAGNVLRSFFITSPRNRSNWLMGTVGDSSTSHVVVGISQASLLSVDVVLKTSARLLAKSNERISLPSWRDREWVGTVILQ